jgi:Tfp pilus assembly protein PilO
MNEVQEYRIPILIGVVTLIVAIIAYVAFIAPEGSKLSTLDTEQTTLQAQQAQLQARLVSLRDEQQKLPSDCAALTKITTQIPSAPDQAGFQLQLTTLEQQTGVVPSVLSYGGTTTTPTPGTPAPPAGVTAIPVSTTVTGTYGQISAFVGGLDGFPRLYVIQSFTLTLGTAGGSANVASTSSSSSNASTPLWVGGTATNPSTPGYSLTLAGSIYYAASAATAAASCQKATAAATATAATPPARSAAG